MKKFAWLHKWGSPKYFYQKTNNATKYLAIVATVIMLLGWGLGLFYAPTDYQQQDAFRIIYVHVPAAFLSMFVYSYIAVLSIVYLVWNIKVADILAESSAIIGAVFTIIALATGSIWGKPMWGTWWVWDARLTSELLLLFIYLGYICLRNAFGENYFAAARASAVVGIVGFINIPIIHYSVEWWQTLHQGPSLSKFSKPDIDFAMLVPLLISILGFLVFYLLTLVLSARNKILWREKDNTWVISSIS